MPNVIYMPRYTNPWEQMLPQFLSQMLLHSQLGKLQEQADARRQAAEQQQYEQRSAMQEEAQIRQEGRLEKAGLLSKGYTPLAPDAEAEGETVTSTTGERYLPPQGKFSPIVMEGKTIPGKYLYTYGTSSPQVVSFPPRYTQFDSKEIDTPQGKVTVGYPMTDQGPAFEHTTVLSKPEKMSMSDVWKGLQIQGLIGLSNEDQRKALFPGLRDQEPKALRQLDIYAKSVGVDPSALRDGTLTEEQATKVVNKMIEVGDKSFLSQLMRGTFGGVPSANNKETREFELLRKARAGKLTPQEQAELDSYGR
jgi:hypothetical protein